MGVIHKLYRYHKAGRFRYSLRQGTRPSNSIEDNAYKTYSGRWKRIAKLIQYYKDRGIRIDIIDSTPPKK